MIEAPNMLLIGSSGRNAGKTELASLLIEKFRTTHEIIAVKVTVTDSQNGDSSRGKECRHSFLTEKYSIEEEFETQGTKDTQRLLAAGASRVYWLRVRKEHLEEGATALLNMIGAATLLICESTSLRTVVKPAVFLMVRYRDAREVKTSARDVLRYADRIVVSDGSRFDIDLNDITVRNGFWIISTNAGTDARRERP